MFNSESDDYQLQDKDKIVIENLYQNGVLIGHKQTLKQSNGDYRETIYDTAGLILSDIKYMYSGQWTSGKIYNNGKIVKYLETDIDSAGARHEIELDTKYSVLSHKKFDVFGRFIGGIVYENNKIIGHKEINYLNNGEIIEIVRDNNYKIILERKLNHTQDKSHETETNAVLIEEQEIHTDAEGKKHKVIYNADHKIVSETELPKKGEPRTINSENTNKAQNNNKMNIFTAFLTKILHKQK